MDAFESLVSLLLRRRGWWTTIGHKVELTKAEKREIGRQSSPRWELDIVGYKGSTNEVIVVECKSYLDSYGVLFRDGRFEPADRFKLFSESILRDVVLRRLATQLTNAGACAPTPKLTLALATGKIDVRTDRTAMEQAFSTAGWHLFDDIWIRHELERCATADYENELALVVAKTLMRGTVPAGRR